MWNEVASIRILMLAACLSLIVTHAAASQEDDATSSESTSKTVIGGPRNRFLADGADALMANDAKRGVELTEQGLAIARGAFERKAGLSNLCAGYLMLNQLQKALAACDQVVEEYPNFWRAYNNRALVLLELGRFEESEADIARGQELSPQSRKLKYTRGRLLDATDPVEPVVEIDERRNARDEDGKGDAPR